jgi:hypothetical protein
MHAARVSRCRAIVRPCEVIHTQIGVPVRERPFARELRYLHGIDIEQLLHNMRYQ